MSPGEIRAFLDTAAEREANRSKNDAINAAAIAYNSAALNRCVRMPETLQRAFPKLFGHTEDGQVLAENWQESERAMRKWAERYSRKR